ncbi:MAG: MipA/OmpV family protein [Deferribacteraceae bacterium]|jgi:outer membrane protein|nr:MipA/OmpV family protein [Deferribacteraceae bacterium]
MKRAILLIILAISSHAYAWELDIGLAGIGHTSIYRGMDDEAIPIPYVGFDSRYLFLHFPSAGVHIIKNGIFTIDAKVSYGSGFDPDDSDDADMKKLDRRKAELAAGVGIKLKTHYGTLELEAMADVRNEIDATSGKLQYSYMLPLTKHFFLIPKLGVEWSNDERNRYHYGISSDESSRSGFASYTPESGRSAFIGLDSMLLITDKAYIILGGRYKRLSKEIYDSPMIDERGQIEAYAAILYRFGGGEESH